MASYISPYLSIPDQQGVGFCVSCGLSNTLEIMLMNSMQTEKVPELSRMYLQAESKARDGNATTQGTYISTACGVLKSKGICEESLLPFDVTDDVRKLKFPTRTQTMHDNARQYRIKSYTTTKDIEKIKAHILKYGSCAMEEFFYHTTFSKNVLVGLGRQSQGQHCTSLIGFDDDLEYKGYKGAFVRLNGDTPQVQYGRGIEIIPYDIMNESHKWFIRAILLTPYETSTYLKDKYYGKRIELPTDKVELQIGSSTGYINGIEKNVSPAPFVKNGTTLVPIRFCMEAFRKVSVSWYGKDKPIVVSSQEGDFYFKIDDKKVRNGYGEVVYEMTIPPMLIDGCTVLPIRAFSEVLGAKVDYNGKTKEITIVK